MAFQKRNYGIKMFSGRDILMNVALMDKNIPTKKVKVKAKQKKREVYCCGSTYFEKNYIKNYVENRDINYFIANFNFKSKYIDNREDYINYMRENKEYVSALEEVLNYIIHSYNLGECRPPVMSAGKISRDYEIIKKKIYDKFVKESLNRKRVH